MAYPEVDSRRGDSLLGMGEIGLTDEDLVLLAELAKGVTVDRVGRRLDIKKFARLNTEWIRLQVNGITTKFSDGGKQVSRNSGARPITQGSAE